MPGSRGTGCPEPEVEDERGGDDRPQAKPALPPTEKKLMPRARPVPET
jgi:hypothetical protein